MKRTMQILALFLIILFSPKAYSQILHNNVGYIPVSDQIDWTNAGLLNTPPSVADTVFTVTDYGALPDDAYTDDAGVQAAINAARNVSSYAAIYFPSGTYYFGNSITLTAQDSNLVLIGDGSSYSVLEFLNSHNSNCVSISGSIVSGDLNVNYNINKGSKVIDVSNFASTFSNGDWIHYY